MVVGFGERLNEAHWALLAPWLYATLKPIELRPTVISPPFRGVQTFPITVRPPEPRPSPQHRLRASYHFTVRSGVSVNVSSTPSGDELVVTVTLNEAAYIPSNPPAPHNVHVPWDGPTGLLAGIHGDGKTAIQAVMGIAGILDPGGVAVVYANGFDTDRYDLPPPTGEHDAENVVSNAVVTSAGVATVNTGYVVDDAQPYPIYGWIRLEWSEFTIATLGATELAATIDRRLQSASEWQPVDARD
jgi:hypothetical protein